MVDFWDSFIRMASALALVLALMGGLVVLVRRFAGTRLCAPVSSADRPGARQRVHRSSQDDFSGVGRRGVPHRRYDSDGSGAARPHHGSGTSPAVSLRGDVRSSGRSWQAVSSQ